MDISIEADSTDDLPQYEQQQQERPLTSSNRQNTASSSSAGPSSQPNLQGRIQSVAGETASDRRYTGGDTLDEPVSATIV